LVKPNEHVVEGQVLFALDPRRLRNQLTVALRAEEAAETEFRQARQFAVTDQKVRATLPVLQGKLEQQAAEVAYLKAQLERTSVRATRSGLAVFDDANDWPGKPVVIGERVMLVADPEKIQLEARLPVADAVALDIGSPVRLFLNVDPTSPREAVLTFVSYQPQKDVDGILSYRIKASFAEGESRPRIGLKGTAKLYGDDVSLAAAMLRRPISAARQWLGF
jgi:multidrug resistance efflux pump